MTDSTTLPSSRCSIMKGLLATFRVSGQRAVREAAPPRLGHRIYDSARRANLQRPCADGQHHNGAWLGDRRRSGNAQSRAQLNLPGQQGRGRGCEGVAP